MTTDQIADRFKKDLKRSEALAFNELKKNIIIYARDKSQTLLMITGNNHCQAGYICNQHKQIFK